MSCGSRRWDFEATYALNCGCFCGTFSGGGRYLQMSQNYRALLVNDLARGAGEVSSFNAGHKFYGGGPTVAFQALYRIGQTGVSLFGNVRGSLLVGSGREEAFIKEVIVDPVNGNQNNLAVNQAYFNPGNAAGRSGDLSHFGGQVSLGFNY